MSFEPELEINQVIDNNKLMETFKVSNSGGMRKSNTTNCLVLVSDHTKGLYGDRWEGDILHYTGMGLEGDQSLDYMQNKTLNESESTDINLFLFEVLTPKRYTYRGRVELVGKPYQEVQPDKNGNMRNAWMFPLKVKHQSSDKNYWFIQLNPKNYDLINAAKELDYDLWRTHSQKKMRAHADELKKGDLCLFWESGAESGFVGFGHVIKEAHLTKFSEIFNKYNKKELVSQDEKIEAIKISYDWLFPYKVRHEYLRELPDFKKEYLCGLSDFPPGTFFQATNVAWDFFQSLLGRNKCLDLDEISYWFGSVSAPKSCKEPKIDMIFDKMMMNEIYTLGWKQFPEDMTNLSNEFIKERIKEEGLADQVYNYHNRIKNIMKIGDIIIAKKGDSPSKPDKRIFGIGVITSDYIFDNNLDPREEEISSHDCHIRNVKWIINFYKDYKMDKIPVCCLELRDVFFEDESFPFETLLPKDFIYYIRLKKAILKKLDELLGKNQINQEYIETIKNNFNKIRFRAQFLKFLSKKIEYFDHNIDLKNKINGLYKTLEDFNKKYPFKENPKSINTLTATDIFIEKEGEPNEVGDFCKTIEYGLKKAGTLKIWTGVYRNIRDNIDLFKDFLEIVVDDKKSLSEKIDIGWGEIKKMGGDKQLAKKIIFCFNSEIIPVFNTEHLQNFYVQISGENDFSNNYDKATMGEKYQFLTNKLLDFKNRIEISRNWNTIFFSNFLYQMIENEVVVSEIEKYKATIGVKILNYLKKNMKIW